MLSGRRLGRVVVGCGEGNCPGPAGGQDVRRRQCSHGWLLCRGAGQREQVPSC
ncbi:MAG TPA: hypothetical protein GXZ24_04720 [Firmicutes bacterium]|nr:hypothetical protein [Bacillota bacterium]